jgi:ATP-binding cassette subfamily F protein 3
MLLVTHDRGFMDNVVTHIVGIHRRKMKKIQGDTSKYYLQVAQDEEIYEKTRVNDEKRKKEIELFISRFRAKARLANMVQSRIKTLAKLETKDKLAELKNLDFSFNYLPFAGKQVMTVEDLSFGYEKKTPLIKNFSLTIYPGDRVGVIGKNGKGKTTLLKLISQNMNPDEGWVKPNPGVEIGYFEQTNIQTLNPQFTVEEELLHAYPETDRQTARNICGAMMFEQDAALKKISVLSGGEKARVMLGKLLIRPLNLLLLDEPSNHLDIESSDAFVEALNAFEGAVVLVTHNEMFLHALANRLVIFTADGIDIFEGTYQEFLEKQGWEDEEMIPVKRKKSAQLPKKELRKKKSQALAERSKQLTPINKKINKIENEIEAKETKMARVNDDLLDASQDQDGLKIATLSKEHAKLESDIETLFDTLAELTERADKIKKKFDQEIFCLESGD